MSVRRWFFYELHGRSRRCIGDLSARLVSRDAARKMAQLLASQSRAPVGAELASSMRSGSAKPNPPLWRFSQIKRAPAGGSARRVTLLGHFHGSPAAAKRLARKLASLLRRRVGYVETSSTWIGARPRRRTKAKRARRGGAIGRRTRARRRTVRKRPVRRTAKRKRKKNPASPAELERARRLYRTFHGFNPSGVTRARVNIPKVGTYLGKLVSVVYESDKWTGKTEHYVHDTKPPRPWLCAGPSGRDFVIVGGRMRTTARGLEH